MRTSALWKDVFNKYMRQDAERVFSKYPTFWGKEDEASEFYGNVSEFLASEAKDITALAKYYKGEARSKDDARIFAVVARETIEHHGYGPDQSRFLAVWYFILVQLPEYDRRVGITEVTDLEGLYECYLNCGEIDYGHDWNG